VADLVHYCPSGGHYRHRRGPADSLGFPAVIPVPFSALRLGQALIFCSTLLDRSLETLVDLLRLTSHKPTQWKKRQSHRAKGVVMTFLGVLNFRYFLLVWLLAGIFAVQDLCASEVTVKKNQIGDGIYQFTCSSDGYVPNGNSVVIVNDSDVLVF